MLRKQGVDWVVDDMSYTTVVTQDSAAERKWTDGAPVRQQREMMLGQAETGGVRCRS